MKFFFSLPPPRVLFWARKKSTNRDKSPKKGPCRDKRLKKGFQKVTLLSQKGPNGDKGLKRLPKWSLLLHKEGSTERGPRKGPKRFVFVSENGPLQRRGLQIESQEGRLWSQKRSLTVTTVRKRVQISSEIERNSVPTGTRVRKRTQASRLWICETSQQPFKDKNSTTTSLRLFDGYRTIKMSSKYY
jgi:hypothetical protein